VENHFFSPTLRVFMAVMRFPLPSPSWPYPATVQRHLEVVGNGDGGKELLQKTGALLQPGGKARLPRLGEGRGPASLHPPLLPPQRSLTFGEH